MQNLLVRRRLLIFTTTGFLATPPLVAIALRADSCYFNMTTPSGCPTKNRRTVERRAARPAAAAAPEVFATQEVQQVRPALKDAKSRLEPLDADSDAFIARVQNDARAIRLRNGFADRLSQSGAAKPAGANGGSNQCGRVSELHHTDLRQTTASLRDGKLVISEKNSWAMRGYQLYGQCAEQVACLGRPLEIDGTSVTSISQTRLRNGT